MPFTPFHFGPGIFVKAAMPHKFSLRIFILNQVMIDLESLFNILSGQYPVHRFLHTFLGSTLVVYHNPRRRDTFGDKKAVIKNIILK